MWIYMRNRSLYIYSFMEIFSDLSDCLCDFSDPGFLQLLSHLWTAVLDISEDFSTDKDISEADQQVLNFPKLFRWLKKGVQNFLCTYWILRNCSDDCMLNFFLIYTSNITSFKIGQCKSFSLNLTFCVAALWIILFIHGWLIVF